MEPLDTFKIHRNKYAFLQKNAIKIIIELNFLYVVRKERKKKPEPEDTN